MNRTDLIKTVIPLLWEVKPTLPKKEWRGSYGAKHSVEHALNFYITNDEFITACVDLGVPHEVGDPNYRFALKDRFVTDWFQPSHRKAVKPYSERKDKWEAYQHTCAEIDRIVDSLIATDTSTDSRFTKLAKVVGYHS
jgi:hypothetical protein